VTIMRIELLTAPGCPHAYAARKIVADCLTTLGIDAPMIDRVGRYPSPTVLVDDVDVMRPGAGASIGDVCRLDLPTPQRVLAALRAATPEQSAGTPQSVAESARQLPPAIRELHRVVLRGFCDNGQVHRDDLYPAAAALGVDLDGALRQLAMADLVHTASDGLVEIAYPFSGRPTGHIVHLDGHLPVAAMCAIDALGVPLMTGSDGVIDSAEPDTGVPIRVQRHRNEWTWQPGGAVIVIGHADSCGTLANSVCRSITFHADPERAQSHRDAHPELHGVIVGPADAIAIADCAFGHLLAD